ncbi:hypothetical protein B0T26DRAFT_687641 [Lasiosphaeria miniovina]|uniref:Uncharacterized protein n=1 Tax=Lasiosphaeria miniovina TaxID=1954250 RepID=A0AA40BH94_9PEZI|nr:uncharacterized protein B0T26DRAFT_687641 [Lasiosphaeria miniovina]KAK0734199.1 hypothetical protein B0T26DRAFT_687641 [Lasiosphaeria miniovina]
MVRRPFLGSISSLIVKLAPAWMARQRLPACLPEKVQHSPSISAAGGPDIHLLAGHGRGSRMRRAQDPHVPFPVPDQHSLILSLHQSRSRGEALSTLCNFCWLRANEAPTSHFVVSSTRAEGGRANKISAAARLEPKDVCPVEAPRSDAMPRLP